MACGGECEPVVRDGGVGREREPAVWAGSGSRRCGTRVGAGGAGISTLFG